MIDFNGTQYECSEVILNAAIAWVAGTMPNASQDAKNAEIAKMLGKGKRLAQLDAKGAHEKTLTERAAQIAKDADFQKYAKLTAQAYANAGAKAKNYAEKFGFVPVPRRNGDGYKGSMPVSAFNAAKLIPFAGEYTAKVLLNAGDDVKIGSQDVKDYHVFIEIDLPELDPLYAGFRENRQKATDSALVYLKDVSDYKCSVSETGELILTDASAHTPGTPRAGGTRTSSDAVKTVLWNGGTYQGTAREIVAAIKANGAKIPATIENYPSHLFTDKCPKSLGIVVKA